MFSNTKSFLFQAVLGIGICLLLVIFINHDATAADDGYCPDVCSGGSMLNYSISADGKCTFTFRGQCTYSGGMNYENVSTVPWTIDASWDGVYRATETLRCARKFADFCLTRVYYCAGNANPWLNDNISCQIYSSQLCEGSGWWSCKQLFNALGNRVPWTPALLSSQQKTAFRTELASKQQPPKLISPGNGSTFLLPATIPIKVRYEPAFGSLQVVFQWKANTYDVWQNENLSVQYTTSNNVATGNLYGLNKAGFWQFQACVGTVCSDWWKFRTIIAGPPLPPSQLKATTISHGQIALTWQASSNPGNGYEIWRRKWGENYKKVNYLLIGPQVTNYRDSGLSAGTTYFYHIRTTNAYGYSDYSNETQATTSPKDIKPSTPPPGTVQPKKVK